MNLSAIILCLSAFVWLADGCASGLGLSQLVQNSQLVGQLARDVSASNITNPVNFAASLDPSKPVIISQLACTTFDNKCPWRTSNLSTIPWFQSQYKFDPNVLNYATGTIVQPDGDYAIAVSQIVNQTNYAVLESPTFCQAGYGYLQLLLWASKGVRVQACSKAISATSFDFCTLFMTENQPGPFSVVIPQNNQVPMKLYIVATNFNYTDAQYSGGFAAIDQLTYSGTDCSSQTTLPSASNMMAQPGGIMSTIAEIRANMGLTSPPPTVRPPGNAATEPKNQTEIPSDVTITEQATTEEIKTRQNSTGFLLFPDNEKNREDDEDEDDDMIMLPAKISENNTNDSENSTEYSIDDHKGDTDSDVGPAVFVFNLPPDVTASSKSVDNKTMPSTTAANLKQQKAEPMLPERIRNLLKTGDIEEGHSTSKQPSLIDQLFKGQKIGPGSSDGHKLSTTTLQPPWYEFTTLYPGQRRTTSIFSNVYTNN